MALFQSLKLTFVESATILAFEFIGTAFITLIVMNFYNELLLGFSPNYTDLVLGMTVVIMFAARISGSHFNPCITFSFLINS